MAIDQLDALDRTGNEVEYWATTEGRWIADTLTPTVVLGTPGIGAYAAAMTVLLTAMADGTDTKADVAAVLATRNDLAKVAGLPLTTPRPTPPPQKPVTVKGRGSVNTKPFALAAGDYTVTIAGIADGNVIADLTLRDKSDHENLFNEMWEAERASLPAFY